MSELVPGLAKIHLLEPIFRLGACGGAAATVWHINTVPLCVPSPCSVGFLLLGKLDLVGRGRRGKDK